MENNNRRKLGTYQICLIALAIVMNVIGGQIALALRLPIYLDSIGTIMIGAMLGPWCGLIPGLLGGLIMAFTGDIYSLYFAPVGMIVGFMSGLAHTGFSGLCGGAKLQRILSLGHISTVKDAAIMIGRAFVISLPGTVVSAFICTVLFGGVTSSGSAILVQFLAAKTPLGLTASIVLVQFLTDFCDRAVSLALVMAMVRVLPVSIKQRLASNLYNIRSNLWESLLNVTVKLLIKITVKFVCCVLFHALGENAHFVITSKTMDMMKQR